MRRAFLPAEGFAGSGSSYNRFERFGSGGPDPETGARTGFSGCAYARSGRHRNGAPAAGTGPRPAAVHIRDSLRPVRGAPAKPGATPRNKLLVRANNRHFIVDANDVVYATIDDGLITLVTTSLEGQSTHRTIEDLQDKLERDMFWRVHRSYLVNINRIKEVVPWFKSSSQLRMDDKKHTEIPVSRVQTRRLRELFKL